MSPDEAAVVERFAVAANELCRFLESTTATSVAIHRELARRLHDLCALALQLPNVEPTNRRPERVSPSKLAITFGERDCYREVFDAYSDDSDEVVVGSLADDMHDIHHELTDGLALFRGGSEADHRDAAWAWRFGFHFHWGEHATSALRALYWLMQKSGEI